MNNEVKRLMAMLDQYRELVFMPNVDYIVFYKLFDKTSLTLVGKIKK